MQSETQDLKSKITKIAVEEKFGFKSANTMVLKDIVEKIAKEKIIKVKVPESVYFSSSEVLNLLNKNSGIEFSDISRLRAKKNTDVDEYFQNVNKLYAKNITDIEIYEKNKEKRNKTEAQHPTIDLGEHFLCIWRDIHKSIKNNNNQIDQEIEYKIYCMRFFLQAIKEYGVKSYFDIKGSSYVKSIKIDQKKNLIIRSTGVEDSWSKSNPGVNKSIFLPAEVNVKFRYIIDFLMAYFTKESIASRINNKDNIDESSEPFIPILFQEVEIGASSGVAIVNSNTFGEGTTKISATLGLNEGVTSGKVSTDEIIITKNNHIYQSVQEKNKTYQLGECEIQEKEPQDKCKKSPAIKEEALRNLKIIFDEISKKYGSAEEPAPLDIEFTVKEDGTIVILQVRPFIEPRKNLPNYISHSFLDKIPQNEKLSIQCISGHSSIVHIQSKEEILFASNLEEARKDFYNKSPEEKNKIKCVIVFDSKASPVQSANATLAHELLEFMYLDKPVISIDSSKIDDIEKSLHETKSLYFDPQNEVMVQAENPLKETQIAEGLISYPSSGYSYSISKDIREEIDKAATENEKQEIAGQKIQDLKNTLSKNYKTAKKENLSFELQKLEELVKKIKTSTNREKELEDAKEQIYKLLVAFLSKFDNSSGANSEPRTTFLNTKIHSIEAIEAFESILKKLETDIEDDSLALIHLRYLEKLVDGENSRYVGHHSLKSLSEKIDIELKHGTLIEGVNPAIFLNEDLLDKWQTGVQSIENDADLKKKLSFLCSQLKELKMEAGLNYFITEEGGFVDKINKWHKEFEEDPTIKQLCDIKKDLDDAESKLSYFTTSANFQKGETILDALGIKLFGCLSSSSMNGTSLKKNLTINIFSQYVHILDTAIKKTGHRTDIQGQERFDLYRKMIIKMKKVYELITIGRDFNLDKTTFNITELGIKPSTCLYEEQPKLLRKHFLQIKYSADEDNLMGDLKNFDPTAYSTYTGTVSYATKIKTDLYPYSLEPYLMIYHQSLKQTIDKLKHEKLNLEFLLPEEIKNLYNSYKSALDADNSIDFNKLELEQKELSVRFSIDSLLYGNSHFAGSALVFDIKYDIETKQYTLNISGNIIEESDAQFLSNIAMKFNLKVLESKKSFCCAGDGEHRKLSFEGENVIRFCNSLKKFVALSHPEVKPHEKQQAFADALSEASQWKQNKEDKLETKDAGSTNILSSCLQFQKNQPNVHQGSLFKEKTDKEKFDIIFTNLKTKFQNKINADEVIEIFKKANQFEGYSNLKWKQINPQPTLDMRSFSKQFQDECLKQDIKTTRHEPRKEVGLRTKRFLEKFTDQEALESYIKNVWR